MRTSTAALWAISVYTCMWCAHDVDEATAGQGVGAASSMLKYAGTEINKRRHELLVAIHGQRGLAWEGDAYDNGIMASQWLRTKGNSIEGGTSEIQLNIIAKRILGLGRA